ncbi:response regulator transcription factor [Conexibacter woesei]|uniref:Two component transcriptional regulator, winged helix family n=1 Tax=Conexibacter woesei (strain DSM 14684 / CCUG 47730 / CIP 108061 / JCM 11494 / NBRC 100937 / ID131577) TaxID=469383 RepID=D3FF64_CONWI|nr:response regulator transcription factor [Conexibacter woesei]ADB51781.1 two component transcriptional regulator, winged helix family [Conexibacter woesei DSM 14684]
MRLLIVEDEERLGPLLARGLRREGCAVDLTQDGTTGLAFARIHTYDLVVLDRDLPGLHGDVLCSELQQLDPIPRILMLTASGTVDDRVEGLGLGADDYLAKPFAFRELIARIRALTRRPLQVTPTLLVRGDLTLDQARRTVTRGGRVVQLRPRELAVLEELLRADGAPLSAEQLLARAWDANADPFSNPVRQTVQRLRKALGEPSPIQTIPGVGYVVP